MPELPEVHTTATILNKLVKGLEISDVWTDYNSDYHAGKDNIKNPIYFKKFKKTVTGTTILSVYRRAKNVLFDLSDEQTIVVHMKMTGHLLYGTYNKLKVRKVIKLKENAKEKFRATWVPVEPEALKDPFNRFIHLVFSLSNGKHLAFSDMRKFATVFVLPSKEAHIKHFENFGPEPLEKDFDWKKMKTALSRRPNAKIKTALMDYSVIAGIGNIYSDEILWASSIHPERSTSSLSNTDFKLITKNSKELLLKGIDFGGDSMSDYRNPLGERGEFQLHHKAYRRTGEKCQKKNCTGKIVRKIIGGRSSHFCDTHQK